MLMKCPRGVSLLILLKRFFKRIHVLAIAAPLLAYGGNTSNGTSNREEALRIQGHLERLRQSGASHRKIERLEGHLRALQRAAAQESLNPPKPAPTRRADALFYQLHIINEGQMRWAELAAKDEQSGLVRTRDGREYPGSKCIKVNLAAGKGTRVRIGSHLHTIFAEFEDKSIVVETPGNPDRHIVYSTSEYVRAIRRNLNRPILFSVKIDGHSHWMAEYVEAQFVD